MRLLYVLDNYWPNIGGAERAFKALCEGMVARGHQVVVLTSRPTHSPHAEEVGGVRVVRVSAGSRYGFSVAGIVPALRLARNSHIIHGATFSAAPVASLAGRIARKPTLLSVFETWIGRWAEFTDFPPLKASVHDLAERTIFVFPFDHYVGISESTTRRLEEVVPRARGRCSTVYFDFDPRPWQGGAKERRFPSSAVGQPFLIVGYGRPGTSKGFKYLVDSFARIREHLPNAALTLVLSEARQYAQGLRKLKERASDGITFLPSLELTDLISLVRRADCVVVPSLSEGFGYTTLEAVAAGVPVVACDTTSIPEVIGGQYLLVPPRDHLAIADAVLKISRGAAERAPLREFPLSQTLDRFEEIYQRLCKP